jgi:hypothetical protein
MAKGSLRGWAIGALVLASACAEPQPAPPPPPQEAPQPAPPPPAPPVPRPARDACGAWELQSLVGRPRTQIPVPVEPSRRRVVCSTCPMTQDYVPYRQTIIYDAQTGLVKEVKCG